MLHKVVVRLSTSRILFCLIIWNPFWQDIHVRHPELNELASSCKRWNESHVDQVTRLIEIHRGRLEAKPPSIDQSGKESEGYEEGGIIV